MAYKLSKRYYRPRVYTPSAENKRRAYKKAGQFRADLFRFCAIWADGGIYLDADLEAVVPFSSMYKPCAHISVGLDTPTGRFHNLEQKQMKILAGAKGTLVGRCMIDSIIERVKTRWTPNHAEDILT